MLGTLEQDLRCETAIDGEVVGSGRASDIAGGLVAALRFALARCARRGMPLRAGYRQAAKLDQALFTPSVKAEQGMHDENISVDQLVASVGPDLARDLPPPPATDTPFHRVFASLAHLALVSLPVRQWLRHKSPARHTLIINQHLRQQQRLLRR